MNVRVFERLEEAEPWWLNAEQQCCGYPYQRFAWLSRWHEEIGAPAGIVPQVTLVQDEAGTPLMLLPLAIRSQHGTRVLTWMGDGVSDLQAPLVHPAYLANHCADQARETWERVRGAVAPHDAVHLACQPERIGPHPNPLCAPGGIVQHLSYQATLAPDWETYYRSRVSKNVRKDTARRARRLADLGEVRFVVADTDGDARGITERMMEQKSRRFLASGFPDPFADERHRRFYLRVAGECAERGFAHISGLLCNDELIATHWAVVANGWMGALFSGYEDGEWARLSAGRLLQEHVMKWCFEQGLAVYDFSIGDEPYKLDWSDRETRLYEHFEAVTWLGKTYTLPRTTHRRAKHSAKRIAPLARAVRSVKGRALRAKAARNTAHAARR